MTTRRLLWGMTWRGAMWGLLASGILLPLYSAGVLSLLTIIGIVVALVNQDVANAVEGLLAIVVWVIGAVPVGILVGAPMGIVIGTAIGIIIGIVTRLFFFPLIDEGRFWNRLRVVSLVLAIFFTILVLGFLMPAPLPDDELVTRVLLVAFPSLIAGQVPMIIYRNIAKWYVEASNRQRDRDKKLVFQEHLRP